MNHEYRCLSHNRDGSKTYDLIGLFPVQFSDFFTGIVTAENAFSVAFAIFDGNSEKWFSPWINLRKSLDGKSIVVGGLDVYREIADRKVVDCWSVRGSYDAMYYVKLGKEEDE